MSDTPQYQRTKNTLTATDTQAIRQKLHPLERNDPVCVRNLDFVNVMTGCETGVCKMWDVRERHNKRMYHTFQGHESAVTLVNGM